MQAMPNVHLHFRHLPPSAPPKTRIAAKTAMPLSSFVNLRSLCFLRVEPRLPAKTATATS